MVINGNLGSFLAFLKRVAKGAASLAAVCHLRPLLWIPGNEGGRMSFNVFMEVLCCERPPGETDMIFKYDDSFFQFNPVGALWSRRGSIPDRKSSLLHMKAPYCVIILRLWVSSRYSSFLFKSLPLLTS